MPGDLMLVVPLSHSLKQSFEGTANRCLGTAAAR